MSVIRRLRANDGGFTLVELGVSMMLAAIVGTLMVTIVASVGRSVTDQQSRTLTQQAVRSVVADLTRDLRQAIPATSGGYAVLAMSSEALEFVTVDDGGSGAVRVLVERTGCAAGTCDLRLRRYASSNSGPDWTFEATPFRDETVLENVDASGAVFTGVTWSGSPASRSEKATCGVGSDRCNFTIVGVVVRSTPKTTHVSERAFEIREEVRIRSA